MKSLLITGSSGIVDFCAMDKKVTRLKNDFAMASFGSVAKCSFLRKVA